MEIQINVDMIEIIVAAAIGFDAPFDVTENKKKERIRKNIRLLLK